MGDIILRILLLALVVGCTRAPLKNREGAVRLAKVPTLQDDLPTDALVSGIQEMITQLKTRSPSDEAFQFAKVRLTNAQYIGALEKFASITAANPDRDKWYEAVKSAFDFYEVYGATDWGTVLLTSYFSPRIAGSLQKTDVFTQPLYSKPEDLLEITLPRVDDKSWDLGTLRGRLVGRKVMPYYSREEIDKKRALRGKSLELCWTDPLDAFVLHIQGSGIVELAGRAVTLNYSDQNGYQYQPIGKYLVDKIPLEKMSLQKIEGYLKGLTPDSMQEILYKNPSYVFFRTSEGLPKTQLGVSVVDGRTIATDTRYFSKGAIGFLEFEKPQFDDAASEEPKKWEKVSRFVLDTDTGGVIKGAGRVDLFWGVGQAGKQSAGVIRQRAKLYYLVPKSS